MTFYAVFGFLLVAAATHFASRGFWQKAFGAPLRLKLDKAIILENPKFSALTFYRMAGRFFALFVTWIFALSSKKDAVLAADRGGMFHSCVAFFYKAASCFFWFEFSLHFVGFLEDIVALKRIKVSSDWIKWTVECVGQATRSVQGKIQRFVLGTLLDHEEGYDDKHDCSNAHWH